MADGQGYSSSSEADRMIIDLDFRSEGDTGKEGAASSANDGDDGSQASPTKLVETDRSTRPQELLPADDMDLFDDIFHRSERSETEENFSANSDHDGAADVGVAESNPLDSLQDDNDSRNDDSDAEDRLVIEELDNAEKVTDSAMGEGGNEEQASSPWDSTQEDAGIMEEDAADDREAVPQSGTSFLENSVPFELSETFLDNLNPQDDSQDLDEEQGSKDEEDEQVATEEMAEDEVRDEKETEVSLGLTNNEEHSSQFEFSETFLDNLNPQEDSLDVEEEAGEDSKCVGKDEVSSPHGEEDAESDKVTSHIPEDMTRNEAPSPSAQPDPSVDEISDADVEQHTSAPSPSTQQDTSPSEDSSSQTRLDSCADEASVSHERQNLRTGELPSAHEEQQVCAGVHQETSSPEAFCPSVQQNDSGDEALSPHAQHKATGDKGSVSQDDSQRLDEGMRPRDQDMVVGDTCGDVASSPCGQQPSAVDKSLHTHEDTISEECSSQRVGQITIPVVGSPVTCQDTTVDKDSAPASPAGAHGAGEEALSPAGEEALSPADQRKTTGCELDGANARQDAEDSSLHSPEGKASAGEHVAVEESGSPSVQRDKAGGEPEEVAAMQDAEDSSVSSPEGEATPAGEHAAEEDPQSPSVQKGTTGGEPDGDTAMRGVEDSPLCSPEGNGEESSTKEDTREEGEYSSSPSPLSEPADNQEGNTSDVLQLSADELEIREDSDNRKRRKNTNSSRSRKDQRPGEKLVNRDAQFQSSPKDRRRDSDDSSTAAPVEVNSDGEEGSRHFQDKLNQDRLDKGEKNSKTGEEDGIDIIETSVDLDGRDNSATSGTAALESSSKESPASGVSKTVQGDSVENGGDEGDAKALQANNDDSDDDVQIIEVPQQETIDTLIVDDDDDDDIVPNANASSKTPVSESSASRTSKKKRTVEHDGHDLRIVVRDERREKEDSDRHHRRRERERREEMRSHSHRRSESDRKSLDRSSRRRHHRSRSHSRERRRKRSRSRSHSRERSSRRRRQRSRSRDRSADREKSFHRKRRRDRSHEHRHRSHSKSPSPRPSREDSWDKENHDASEHRSKRRRHRQDEERTGQPAKEQKSSSKRGDSPPQRSSQKQNQPWKPSDTFLNERSATPSSVHTVGEKSDYESEGSVEEVAEGEVLKDRQEVVSDREVEVIPVDIPIPRPEDIPIPKPEDIPIPETKTIPVPEPQDIPFPVPELVPVPASVVLQPPPMFENPPLPPVPEEEPMENPPEPPPLPPRWPEGMPPKGEGLLPTPIRRKAALEEAAAAAAYDPAHPTDDEGERFRFPGVPNAGHPPPEMLGGPPPPRLPGQMMSDGRFVVPAPGEGGLLGPPPQRVPMQAVRFGPPRPMMMNHVVPDHPPFNNGPFPSQPPGPPLPPRFHMEIGGPGGVMQLQNQFGQGPPPGPGQGLPPPGQGPPPSGPHAPPQGFPGQLTERFEEGPPMSQFPVSVHSGMPEMAGMVPPPGPPPPDMHMLSHPPPPDMTLQETPLPDDEFDKTLASLVVAQNLLSVMNDHKAEGEPGALPPSSVFKVPPPRLEPQAKSPSWFPQATEPQADMDQSEDSTEVLDMDMSPLDDEIELRLPNPVEGKDADPDKDKKSKPLAAIDLRAISNAILKLTSAATDDVPASAVELTNKEKYMKKLHLQERVVDEVKQALRPFYSHKKIDKEEYKTILRKAVPKVCHSRSGDIDPQKIQQLVEGYVSKFQKQRQYSEQKVKPPKHSPKEKGKANGERAKPAR